MDERTQQMTPVDVSVVSIELKDGVVTRQFRYRMPTSPPKPVLRAGTERISTSDTASWLSSGLKGSSV